MKGRILWLDGVKGAACMCVFLHHFMVGFYPAAYFGEAAGEHLARFPGFERAMAQLPLPFLNGHFLVCLFCVVSGAVLSLKVMRAESKAEAAAGMILKRYFRLALPILAAQAMVCLALKMGLSYTEKMTPEFVGHTWLQSYLREPFSVMQLLSNSLIGVEFTGESLIGTTWMISELFLGGIFSIALSLLTVKSARASAITAGIWSIGLMFKNNLYASFALGTLLALILNRRYEPKTRSAKLAFWAGGGIGLLLAGYPSGVSPHNLYRLLTMFTPGKAVPTLFWHQGGAFLLLLSAAHLKPVRNLFEGKVPLFLGRISFAVYLMHFPVICTLSSWMMYRLSGAGVTYTKAACLTLCATVCAVTGCAWLFNRLVERPCGKAADALARRLTS